MKTLAICFLVIALAVAVISVANEQSPKPKAPLVDQIMNDVDSSVPIKFKVADIAVTAYVSALAKPETADKMARYVKHFRIALIKEGFTKEEALKIITAMPLPNSTATN
jgi:hypothetical protein